ncbi:MAG: hypothetical protein LBE85_08220 [Candidatus Accumulibacter sp.]|nr:hypothetical protein [Accumulibacter sp.]
MAPESRILRFEGTSLPKKTALLCKKPPPKEEETGTQFARSARADSFEYLREKESLHAASLHAAPHCSWKHEAMLSEKIRQANEIKIVCLCTKWTIGFPGADIGRIRLAAPFRTVFPGRRRMTFPSNGAFLNILIEK